MSLYCRTILVKEICIAEHHKVFCFGDIEYQVINWYNRGILQICYSFSVKLIIARKSCLRKLNREDKTR
jgi:hypothetical protein